MADSLAPATGIAAHITVIDGQPTTTTQDIAAVFSKRHDHVLNIVRQRMEEAGAWRLPNFWETVTERANPSGGEPIKSPVIRMTEKGFMFVVQKFTGKKAVQTQIAYVDEFERMRAALRQPAAPGSVSIHAQPDADRTASAFMAAAWVQKSVFNSVLAGGEDWKHQRWLVSFITDSREATPAWVDKLGADAFIGNGRELADAIRRGAFQREELLDINEALAHRLYMHSCSDGAKGIGAQVTTLINRNLSQTDLREIATCAMLELWGRAASAKENPAIAA